MSKRKRLTMTKIEEVSLVDRGDNPTAHVVIHKRADPPTAPAATPAEPGQAPAAEGGIGKRLARVVAKLLGRDEAEVEKAWDEASTFGELQDERKMDRAISEACRYVWDLESAISSTLRDPDATNKAELIRTSLTQFTAAVDAAIPKWIEGDTVEKVEKVGRKMSADRLARLKDTRDSLSALIAEAEPQPQGDEMAGTTQTTETTQVATPPTVAPAATDDVSKALEDLRKRAEAAEARAAAAETLAKSERDARELAVIEKSVEADLVGLPGVTPAEFAPVVKALKEKAPEEFAKLEPVLKGAAAAIRTGKVFEETGRGGSGDGGAYQQIVAKAEEIRKAQPTLTLEQAMDKAMSDNPELVKQYRAELQ